MAKCGKINIEGNKGPAIRNNIYLAFFIIMAITLAFSTPEAGERITRALCSLVNIFKSIIAPIIVLVIVLAAVIYGAGHVLGQEFGARAKSWALNMVIFAAIGVFLYLILPVLFKQFAPEFDVENACA
jgi:hypothetical protein